MIAILFLFAFLYVSPWHVSVHDRIGLYIEIFGFAAMQPFLSFGVDYICMHRTMHTDN